MTGYRVLDFTSNVAGPLAGQILADLGAEVIKIEPPRGEAARHIVPTGAGKDAVAPYFTPYNRGKRSLVVDLHTAEGIETVLDLVAETDVLLDGFRPGTMTKWGLSRATIHNRNPGCVYASLTAYGGNGPHGGRPGIDLLLQAESGMLAGLAKEDGTPIRIPFTPVDAATGHVLAQAILAALLHRERHGAVTDVDVAMYDVAVSLQANRLTTDLNRGTSASNAGKPADRSPRTSPFSTSPSGIYRAADGYLVLAAYIPKHWAQLVESLGSAFLGTDPRFADQYQRAVNDTALTEELERIFSSYTVADLVQRLQAAGLMATEVKNGLQVIASELFAENELESITTDGSRTEKTVRTPARYGAFRPAATTPTPVLDEYSAEVVHAR
ncbi:CoA transferase [Nocardia salmonicida]|uniref:CaiB/BaiF CoA transferase family protein n=1 Tax=Nocardia salmonicida TaxID=53431 RepID=UPI00340E3C7F